MKSPRLSLEDNVEKWVNADNKLHRNEKDGPAIIREDGEVEYWKNGRKHRINGPAVITPYKIEWWQNGQRHRKDGPAIIYSNGMKEWWRYGQRHRIDGPAMIWPLGEVAWFLENAAYDTFEKWAKDTPISDEEIAFMKLKYDGRWEEND